MLNGLMAAAGFGVSTMAAAAAARRIGTYRALLIAQVAGFAVLAVLAAGVQPRLSPLAAVPTAAGLAAAGALSLAAWYSYYKSLECGPVAAVSAVGATSGGVAALLAVALLGEHLGLGGGAGVACAVAGITVTASGTRPPDGGRAGTRYTRRRYGLRRAGIPLAIISALTDGGAAFLIAACAPHAGWLPSAAVECGCSVTILLVARPCAPGQARAPRGPQPARRGDLRGLAAAAVAGLAGAGALIALARGGQGGDMAVTAALSSTYPVIPLALSFCGFRERVTRLQVLGVCCIIAGLVLLSPA